MSTDQVHSTQGIASVKMTAFESTYSTIQKSGLNLNLSKLHKTITIDVYSSNYVNISGIYVTLMNDAGNYFYKNFPLSKDGWNNIEIQDFMWETEGSPSWESPITAIQIEVDPLDAGADASMDNLCGSLDYSTPNCGPILEGFENPADWVATDCSVEADTAHVTQGEKSLRVTFTNKEQATVDKAINMVVGNLCSKMKIDLFVAGSTDFSMDISFFLDAEKTLYHKITFFDLSAGWNTIEMEYSEWTDDGSSQLWNVAAVILEFCFYTDGLQAVDVSLDNFQGGVP